VIQGAGKVDAVLVEAVLRKKSFQAHCVTPPVAGKAGPKQKETYRPFVGQDLS